MNIVAFTNRSPAQQNSALAQANLCDDQNRYTPLYLHIAKDSNRIAALTKNNEINASLYKARRSEGMETRVDNAAIHEYKCMRRTDFVTTPDDFQQIHDACRVTLTATLRDEVRAITDGIMAPGVPMI